MSKKVTLVIIVILFFDLIGLILLFKHIKDNEIKQYKTEMFDSVKDSIAKAIIVRDSNIVEFTIKYDEEKQKAVQLSDSAAIELFKQLCNE